MMLPVRRIFLMAFLRWRISFLVALNLALVATTTTAPSSKLRLYMVRSPETTVAPLGDEVLFECALNVEPERLQWRFRSQSGKGELMYLNETAGYNITFKDGVSKLRIYVSPKTIGEYQCIAWYGASALASVSAKLTLATITLGNDNHIFEQDGFGVNILDGKRRNPPPQIVHWQVSPGNSVIIKCGDIVSNPPPVWSYFKDNTQIRASVLQLSSGALILTSLTQKDSGSYWCSAVNSITGMEIKIPRRTDLNVTNTPKAAPIFLSQPPTVITVKPGATAILECPGVGNPVPKAVWSRPDVSILNNRTLFVPYGLQITKVVPEDRGNYVCRLDNGISPVLIHTIRLDVLEAPAIIEGPRVTLTNETDMLHLDCHAKGYPVPVITWMINGVDVQWDSLIHSNGSSLFIKSVQKRHAGIVQCFAKNAAGEVNEGNLLQVNPKQIPGEIEVSPLGSVPESTKSSIEHAGKQKGTGRKKHKHRKFFRTVMIPPSRPSVTRLSDESVMVRWSVPSEEGLPIQFFKVQYRMLGDLARKIPRSQWMTCSEDIPPHVRSYEVQGLKPDQLYRFRIAAVYSNNDNKLGNTSGKFHLQKASQLSVAKSHLTAPTLQKVEGVTETAIRLSWGFPSNPPTPIDGFYIHFRPASTAGEYSKAMVDGMHVRHWTMDYLEPGTAYEFKLQSFTASAASEFSAILTGKTLKPPTQAPTITPSVVAASESSQSTSSNLPLIAGGAGGGGLLLLLIILTCVCIKKRKKTQADDGVTESKAHPDHIQAEPNGFPVGGGRVLGSPIHKSSRLNGVVPRMNITANPLAQEGDKFRNQRECSRIAM
ncbi:interference hedgehog isoform X3 [Lutzomyia longipalpis]|uniref:interference hedgehog isoform X3 n=1 Tax=Lutzomyia longipalpis TaxID=7200 RepID=UPI002483A73D|nr:interference hedgehog isoform X3 [Lutzomyia longipalpis]XP_055684509.1 interference hedgehog isoform X3 [Lutzomyia longipalpis]